jgi:tetratricopeptide (TPR) repeat protein
VTLKQIILLLCCLLIGAPLLVAQEADSLQHKAQQADKTNNADLYYNLGVDYFAAGNQGMANLYFLRALNLNSAHKMAKANLDLAVRLSSDANLYPERLFLVRALFQGLDFLSVNRVAYLSLILLLFSGLSLLWLLFYDPDKERALPILVLILFATLCLGSFSIMGFKSYAQKHNQQAVVVARATSLMPMDTEATKPITEIHAGLIVTVLETKPDYYAVRLPNGQVGRVVSESLRQVRAMQ